MFLAEIPVIGPLKVNTYIVKGAGEDLIIDPGPSFPLSKVMLLKCLGKLTVNLRRSIFFATHSHADHFGLIEKFTNGLRVYMSHKEVDLLFEEENVREILDFAVENGFSKHDAAIVAKLMLRRSLKKPLELAPLRDGDVIDVGDYKLRCIETPGHTRGHMCLYDLERKFLISGDHVLSDVTPNISSWSYEEDTLGSYLSSLKRTYEIDARLVLPGHGEAFTGLKRRIVGFVNHYRCRLVEIINILRHRSGDAYWLSSKIKWGTRHPVWARTLNVVRRWLAFGETLAYLNFLVKLGIVERKVLESKTLYSVVDVNAVDELNRFFSRILNS